MKTCARQRRKGIQWTLWTQLEDLDFADDLALLSHNHQQMQEKISELAATSSRVDLHVHSGKTKVLKVNAESMEPVTLEVNEIEEVETFTYLGNIIDKQGDTNADVKQRIWEGERSICTTQEHLELQSVVITH